MPPLPSELAYVPFVSVEHMMGFVCICVPNSPQDTASASFVGITSTSSEGREYTGN